ncbi:bifunctional diaminohydroxyphosphoribosylaminopyrimidine deaminase/5-amino-6-(5-phosphoribosylamino)uracil reductase RibD [Corynebacterium propinquum]
MAPAMDESPLAAHILNAALAAAHKAGDTVRGSTSPNPPVGAVLVTATGEICGIGATEPPGGRHAEIVALEHAGAAARGAHAVVTLEPCNHFGRTGPCAQALIDAGVASVHYVHADPNAIAAGGAEKLRAAGIPVFHLGAAGPNEGEIHNDELRPWLHATAMGRVHVTVKFAQSVDGFSAAIDGSSQWITGTAARERVHLDRSKRDAIIIGTGTALADNPSLTARYTTEAGDTAWYQQQPQRVVIGASDLTECSNLQRLGYAQYPDIPTALTALWEQGCRDVLVEGGPKLLSAFVAQGYADAVQAYIAPLLLGQGRSVLESAVGESLAEGMRLQISDVEILGGDVLLTMVPGRTPENRQQ